MIKKFILPIVLALVALVLMRVLDSDTPPGGLIMFMVVGAGIGVYLNTIIFKED